MQPNTQRNGFQARLYALLDPKDDGLAQERYFNWFLGMMIVLSVISVILDTDQELSSRFATYFSLMDGVALSVFTLEYLGRVYVAPIGLPQLPGWRARLAYITSFMGVLDLLAFLPFLVALALGVDSQWLFVLALMRLLRIVKLSRFWPAMSLVVNVLYTRRYELGVSLGISNLLLILSGSVMYLLEHEAQPDKFGSIPDAMWWAIITLATIGYGDTFPITTAGKLVAGIMALVFLSLFALPAAILTAGFSEAFQAHRENRKDRA
jgi:voltage-gated potassium channel